MATTSRPYKYLWIMEGETIKYQETKDKNRKQVKPIGFEAP